MTPLNKTLSIFAIIEKSWKYENGALFVLAGSVSAPAIDFLKILFQGITTKTWALPFVVFGVFWVLYLGAFSFDFWTGLKAAKHESGQKRGYFKSEKAWSSIYKLFAVTFLMFSMCFFSLVFALIGFDWGYTFFLYAVAVIGLMAFLFDMHSIGENYRRRFGKGLRIFEWLDEMTAAINEGFIKEAKGLFSNITARFKR